MPLFNSTSNKYCSSTNLFQQSVNDGNCIATQSSNLDVCMLFRLRNISGEIFCFVFGQLWHCEISTKQSRKLPRSFRNGSDYALLANETWFQPKFFMACAVHTVHYFWHNPRISSFTLSWGFKKSFSILGHFLLALVDLQLFANAPVL